MLVPQTMFCAQDERLAARCGRLRHAGREPPGCPPARAVSMARARSMAPAAFSAPAPCVRRVVFGGRRVVHAERGELHDRLDGVRRQRRTRRIARSRCGSLRAAARPRRSRRPPPCSCRSCARALLSTWSRWCRSCRDSVFELPFDTSSWPFARMSGLTRPSYHVGPRELNLATSVVAAARPCRLILEGADRERRRRVARRGDAGVSGLARSRVDAEVARRGDDDDAGAHGGFDGLHQRVGRRRFEDRVAEREVDDVDAEQLLVRGGERRAP